MLSDLHEKSWKILSKEDVSPSKWFPIEKHEVELPSGKIVDDYFISTLGDVVIVLAITPDNQVVIVEQYKHGLGQLLLELPGGMRQEGTTLMQSALNELEEETGIKADESALFPLGKFSSNPTKTNQVTYGYIVFNAQFNSQQKLDETEDINVLTFPAADALQMVLTGKIWVSDSANFIFMAAQRYPEIFHPSE